LNRSLCQRLMSRPVHRSSLALFLFPHHSPYLKLTKQNTKNSKI
jgi:hypothetical protein